MYRLTAEEEQLLRSMWKKGTNAPYLNQAAAFKALAAITSEFGVEEMERKLIELRIPQAAETALARTRERLLRSGVRVPKLRLLVMAARRVKDNPSRYGERSTNPPEAGSPSEATGRVLGLVPKREAEPVKKAEDS